MTHITADISACLDGFATGADPSPGNGLGTGGEALRTWAFSDGPDDLRVLRRGTARSGAVVRGRRLFDVAGGPKGWDDTSGYGAGEAGEPAFVVVTSSPPRALRLTDVDWTFVVTGLSDAFTAARERSEAAASDSGKDRDVIVMDGGDTVGPALEGGLVDALTPHLASLATGRRDTIVDRRGAGHAGAAEGRRGIDRDAPEQRRLAGIR